MSNTLIVRGTAGSRMGRGRSAHICALCGRAFSSGHALGQHTDAKHSSFYDDEDMPEAPAGLEGKGEWRKRHDFHGKKSFGFFTCTCGAYWLSAHAFTNEFKQMCKTCRKWWQPELMWHNYSTPPTPATSSPTNSAGGNISSRTIETSARHVLRECARPVLHIDVDGLL